MADHVLLDNQKRIFVIGYFGHSNTGDQQYPLTFDYVFKTFLINHEEYSINYLDCDRIKITEFKDTDIIILGGGDILNNYFLDQIIAKFINKSNKIIAVSVGLPYIDILLNTNKLNIIDYMFVRSQQDIELFKKYFHPHRIFFLPDISFFLLNLLDKNSTLIQSSNHKLIQNQDVTLTYKNDLLIQKHLQGVKRDGKKIVAITLSRHIYDPSSPESYYSILNSFVKFIKYLLTFGYYIVLLPFNTNEQNRNENDILIHNDIMKILNDNPHMSKNIMNLTTHLEPLETLELYQYFYITIPMRFHAVLFSIYAKVPMLPIFTTRKIKNLLLDVSWTHGYELECNDKDIPVKMDELVLINRFRTLIDLHEHLRDKLLGINRDFFINNLGNMKRLTNLITCDYSKISFSLDTNIIESKIKDVYDKIQELAKKRGYSDFRLIKDEHNQKLMTQVVSYHLTNGTIESPYNYGLSTKMFNINYKYKDEWSWIIKDNNQKYLQRSKRIFNNPYGMFNINYIDQVDYSGVHRSGWQYVYENIKYLHNDASDLYLDLYLDRTFHWNKEINKELGLIPYKTNWIGFVHHTFDTSFSEYNNYNLINNPDFIESLNYCKGIFVLSKYLRRQFMDEFNKRGIFVPVYEVMHPTEVAVPQFTYKNFVNNSDKKLVHIGGWLRDIYSFYNLCIPSKYRFSSSTNTICDFVSKNRLEETMRKVALKGSYMNNYYPSSELPNKLQTFLTTLDIQAEPNCQNSCKNSCQNCCQNVCQNACQNACQNSCQNSCQNTSQNCSQNSQELRNNWYKHFHGHVKYMCNGVDFIDKLSNDDYDQLLTENIVFINLVDSSAVNTIIECIVRNTPIIVNDHPAVVELLGPNYPLYFKNNYQNYFEMNQQVVELLSNTNNIKKAYQYLIGLNKSRFNVTNFTNQFVTYLKHLKE